MGFWHGIASPTDVTFKEQTVNAFAGTLASMVYLEALVEVGIVMTYVTVMGCPTVASSIAPEGVTLVRTGLVCKMTTLYLISSRII